MSENQQPAGQGNGTEPADDPDWPDPTDPFDVWDAELPVRVPSMPVLHLDGFDGPMDLLLNLAERQRVDLGRMSMADLAEQFVAQAERLVDTAPLEQRAAWLVLATRLLLLRSRLLLPASPAEAQAAERDATAELRRLDTLGAIRVAAAWLGGRSQLGRDLFARAPSVRPAPQGGYVALMEACLVVLRGRTGQRGQVGQEAGVYWPALPDLWSVSDALARIRALLAEHPDGSELASFLPPVPPEDPQRTLKARAAVASTLVAGLELTRIGCAEMSQQETFGATQLRAVMTTSEEGQALRSRP